MNRMIVSATLLAFFLFWGLVACGEPTPPPVRSNPTVENLNQPTATAAAAVSATPAPEQEPEPTTSATAVPSQTTPANPTATAVATEPVSYTITVSSPQPGQGITVARDFTFSGTISPVPSQRLELELVAAGTQNNGESMVAFAEVDPTTGSWQITEPIHPRRTGPAMLHVRAAGVELSIPVRLRLAEDETSTIVTVNQPLAREIVVAGHTLLISGESRNLIDGNIQVGLFGCPADSDENLIAQIEFEGGNGPWRAQIIVPQTAAANCDTARLRVTTGGLTSDHSQVAWASDQFLTLVTPLDDRANLLTVWDPNQLRFTPGQTTAVSGTAVNPVDGQVLIELIQNEVVVAAATAVPDTFGYWETSLTPPADAEPGEVLLRLSTGSGAANREMSLPTNLGS